VSLLILKIRKASNMISQQVFLATFAFEFDVLLYSLGSYNTLNKA
jgi:hypothetical protein